MDPELWRRIEEIYDKALDLEPDQRQPYINQCCAGNERLHREIDRLLQVHHEAEAFIESPAVAVAARALFGKSAGSSAYAPGIMAAGKHSKYPPWWMYLLGVAFLICTIGRYFDFYIEPEYPGLAWKPGLNQLTKASEVLVTSVSPDSAAARAGIKVGDFIQVAGSEFLDQSQPGWGYGYWQSGYPYRLHIRRGEERKEILLKLNRASSFFKWFTGSITRNAILLQSFVFLVLALIVSVLRSYDASARWGALMMAVVSITLSYGIASASWYNTMMEFPRPVMWLTTLVPTISAGMVLSVTITFFAMFPRRLFKRYWIWALVWLPAVIFIPHGIISNPEPVYSIHFSWPRWYEALVGFVLLIGHCAVVVVAILNYRRLRDRNERRRARIIFLSFIVCIVGLSPLIMMTAFYSLFVRLFGGMNAGTTSLLSCIALTSPVLMAYAILRHRVFDIRVMIRQGVRYAAARGALLSLVPIVAILMAGDLLLHRSQPLGEILDQRGLLYAVLAGGGLLLHLYRQKWLTALDRRFFREHYDAQRVLRSVIDEIHEARSFEKIAPSVVSKIEAALHPEFTAVLVRRPGAPNYRVLAAREKAPPPIPADSKLIRLIRLLGKPVDISQSQTGWLSNQLPMEESEFLRRARLEWLFPISLAEGQTEALLAVGPKRSESPYSREDQELLQGITSSLGLLLEQSPVVVSLRKGFEECPECGSCYDTGSGSCRKEGATLTPLPFSRLLAERYRFEQRLGEGGMGVVYRAFDMALERQVAVKLIRPELTVSADAAVRFKQEAKAAASFTHPNVVTVYDYGVSEEQRAYIVMELLRGSTLRQALSAKGRLSVQHALEILSGVCMAMDAAHRKRMLHRDLKPENIFLADSDGVQTAKLLDFGIVKKIASGESATLSIGQTGPGMLVGTLKYMSPEELRGEPPAESWDLWALAVVAYEMLTAKHPFTGSTSPEIRNAILDGRIMPLHAHFPAAPEGWQQFFDKALALDPASRPQSAFQLLSEFRKIEISV
ncbi:MAG: protein kinase [Acidobacteria bacterium]|nr:protein kinase [Acidobacteriota bacterium]